MIDGLYHPSSVDTVGAAATDNYVPVDWGSDAALYSTVVKKYCRACHIAQSTSLDFFDFSAFDSRKFSIDLDICTSMEMPHAEAAFANFWFSMDPAAPHYLADGTTGLGFDDTTCPK